jgi:xanthine dehydrogenase accessory factor
MMQNIHRTIYEFLKSDKKIILAKIIRRSGSAPRGIGSMCIITQKGDLVGTIGGGLVEYKAKKEAEKLMQSGKSSILHFHMTEDDLAGAGMICGGRVDIYLEPLFPENQETMSVYNNLCNSMETREPGILATVVKDGISAGDTGTRAFFSKGRKKAGDIPGFDIKNIKSGHNAPAFELISPKGCGSQIFIEHIRPGCKIFLFGAGHVSAAVSRLAKTVDFEITLIDDRPEFANRQRFPEADEIMVEQFSRVFNRLKITDNSYIVIMTRGHIHDKIVLEQALATDAAYIGMIGSRKKRDTIYRALMDQGFSHEALKAVHSPIGIDINARTPEEIAVSIVGELIRKRNPPKHTESRLI